MNVTKLSSQSSSNQSFKSKSNRRFVDSDDDEDVDFAKDIPNNHNNNSNILVINNINNSKNISVINNPLVWNCDFCSFINQLNNQICEVCR